MPLAGLNTLGRVGPPYIKLDSLILHFKSNPQVTGDNDEDVKRLTDACHWLASASGEFNRC